MEKWETIPEFPAYEVSNHGRIRNIETGYILKPARHPRTGLLFVPLRRDRRQHIRTIHRLVAHAFLYPPPEGCVPIHLDGDRENNHVDNLDWKTLSYARELTQERSRKEPMDPRPVRRKGTTHIYENALTAARAVHGFERYILYSARSNGSMSYKGALWEFAD